MIKRITFGRLGRTVHGAILTLASVALLVVVAGCSSEPDEPSVPLPSLGVDTRATSVSGISAGAYMAGQFELAFAKDVVGAAIIAGGPYGCSESIFAGSLPGIGTPMLNLSKAINGCMLNLLGAWGVADPKALARTAANRAERGEIGALDDVRGDRVYLFSGSNDRTVVPSIVAAAEKFYREIGVPAANLKLVSDVAAGHAFVTDDAGRACATTGEPFVVDCDYDQAGVLLAHIYGPLQPRSSDPLGQTLIFDQTEFIENRTSTGLAQHGAIYVPQACENAGGCRVHIAFHGCGQNRATVKDAFVAQSGLNRWADNNRIVVLYPQVATTPTNPQACWDWWGYTGDNYLSKNAKQTTAVRKMLQKLGEPRPAG